MDSAVRRLLDIFGALSGLLLLWPLFVLIALRVKRDSPGPIFFWGPRMGKDGRPFRILKFRTMYERPESYYGPKITAQADDRITPIGHWLRDTKLNELPQLWNVLIGEMSLVGPRPEDPDLVQSWPKEVRRELLNVRPGITSPASVLYRDEEQLLNAGRLLDDYLRVILPSKLRLDLLYVRHRTLLSDLDGPLVAQRSAP
jgi:lipopolysaccharide/colanic/teichoic acid biosynthesis glycosyltransferase